jgi:hypothetical protein
MSHIASAMSNPKTTGARSGAGAELRGGWPEPTVAADRGRPLRLVPRRGQRRPRRLNFVDYEAVGESSHLLVL